jgi:N-acetylglucosamine kinase-like BadF-type ATPase
VSAGRDTAAADVLAVDGGNSKLDVALVDAGGVVLGAARGGGAPFTPDSMGESIGTLLGTARRACLDAGIDPDARPIARVGALCLAGADLPVDDRRLLRALRPLRLAGDAVLRNDTFAVLRAGTERSWGIGVVCGTGMNCCAVAPNGRTVRYAALGEVSGDDGGGGWVGLQAVRAAVRGHDGRGPHTVLEHAVPAFLGRRSLLAVLEAVQTGELGDYEASLAPLVFQAAGDGDAVAQAILDHQADEVVAMVASAARRLHLTRRDVEVVLGGGLVHAGDGGFLARLEAGIRHAVPAAQIKPLTVPPVVGAALLGLDRIGPLGGADARIRRTLTRERLATTQEA